MTPREKIPDDTKFLDRITSYMNMAGDRINLHIDDVRRMHLLARNGVKDDPAAIEANRPSEEDREKLLNVEASIKGVNIWNKAGVRWAISELKKYMRIE